jgi:hypothetical protein
VLHWHDWLTVLAAAATAIAAIVALARVPV